MCRRWLRLNGTCKCDVPKTPRRYGHPGMTKSEARESKRQKWRLLESVPVRRREWFAESGQSRGVKQLQPHGKGIVGKGFAVNKMLRPPEWHADDAHIVYCKPFPTILFRGLELFHPPGIGPNSANHSAASPALIPAGALLSFRFSSFRFRHSRWPYRRGVFGTSHLQVPFKRSQRLHITRLCAYSRRRQ